MIAASVPSPAVAQRQVARDSRAAGGMLICARSTAHSPSRRVVSDRARATWKSARSAR